MKKLILLILFLPFTSIADIGFIENVGQIRQPDNSEIADVLYAAQCDDIFVTLRKNGFSYELKTLDKLNIQEALDAGENLEVKIDIERIDFFFPSAPSTIVKLEQQKNKIRFYDESGYYQPNSFERIIYREVAPGVDIEFLIVNGRFKYNIIKNENAELSDFYIDLVSSRNDFEIIDNQLLLSTECGDITETIPYSYTVNEGEVIDISYKLIDNRLFFKTDESYINDHLVIDPVPDVVWSTYFGGDQYDIVTSFGHSENNEIVQTGITMSLSNVSTSGAFITNYQGDLDAFVSKFNKEGDLIWSTYYGGPQTERVYNITVDNGDIYLAGNTFSTIGISSGNIHQPNIGGMDDVFILKMNENGIREWCTYYGGSAHDDVMDIYVMNDSVYICGHTASTNNITTISNDSGITDKSATADGYLSLFDANGILLWGTYYGTDEGSSVEGIIANDSKVMVTGITQAATGIATAGTHQQTLNGFVGAFVAQFSKAGVLEWGTYYGGPGVVEGIAIASDNSGGVFVVGNTNSGQDISTPGAFQEMALSSEQGFLAHFDNSGTLQWGTFIGGSGTNYLTEIATSDSTIYIGGQTLSTDYISTSGSYQTDYVNSYDGFIMQFTFDGLQEWGSYLGGIGNETIYDLAITSTQTIVVSGGTDQMDTLFGIGNSHSSSFSGGSFDGFLMYLCQPFTPTITYANDTLWTNPGDEIQWFFEGNPIGNNGHYIVPQSDGQYTVQISSGGKCISESMTYNHSTVGLVEHPNELINNIFLYPNPASDEFSVLFDGEFEGEIVTIEGRIVHKFKGNDQSKIHVTHLPNSIYFVQVHNKTKSFKGILIKN